MEYFYVVYAAIGLGVAIGVGIDEHCPVNANYHWSVVFIGSIVIGLTWPVFIAARLVQKI